MTQVSPPSRAPSAGPGQTAAAAASTEERSAPDRGRPSLAERFLQSAALLPERTALVVGGTSLTYAELRDDAGQIAQAILDTGCACGELVGILAHRSRTAFSGVLGALMAGCGYVPLHPVFPAARTRRMAAGLSIVVVGAEAIAALDDLLDDVGEPLTIIGPEIIDFGALQRRRPRHRFIAAAAAGAFAPLREPRRPSPDDVAYLLFTSGSTGVPKGVPVAQRNAAAYLDHIADRFDLQPQDRVSQTFDLTFDLSVHDLFASWQAGAALCVLPSRAVMAPAKFIVEQRLTVWFSVPSVAMMMARLRLLRPSAFPTLRLSLFCGEALPLNCARRWAEAAPNARLENLYGPTEATIAIAGFQWRGDSSAARCRRGIVPIGTPFPRQSAELVGDHGGLVSGPGRGELLLAGSQVTAGYWQAPDKTAERFVRLPEFPELLWYRTGDIVERDGQGCLHFVGRADSQVKVNGHRVELLDVDAALREATCSDLAVSVLAPFGEAGLFSIVGCIDASTRADDATVLRRCAELLPPYMVPSRLRRVTTMPLNVNGKIDRPALQAELRDLAEAKAGARSSRPLEEHLGPAERVGTPPTVRP